MTALQQRVYQEFIRSAAARRMLQAAESGTTAGSARVLSAITALKKLCNHPKLIYDAIYSNTGNAADGFEVHFGPTSPHSSNISLRGARHNEQGRPHWLSALKVLDGLEFACACKSFAGWMRRTVRRFFNLVCLEAGGAGTVR